MPGPQNELTAGAIRYLWLVCENKAGHAFRPLFTPVIRDFSIMVFRQRVLLSVFLFYMAYGISLTMLGPCVTSIEETFGVGHGAMGLLLAFGSVGYLLGVRAGGRLARPLGLSRTIAAGVVLQAAGLLCLAGAPAWPVAIAGQFLFSFGGGALEPASMVSVQLLYHEEPRGAMNLSQVGFGIGAITGPFLAKIILGAGQSWRLAFVIPAVAGLAMLALLPRKPIHSAFPADEEGIPARRLFANPVFWLAFGAMLFYVAAELGLSSWSSAFFEEDRGLSKANASLAPLCLWLGILIGRAAMWKLGDRISSRKVLAGGAAISIACATAAVAASNVAVAMFLLVGCGLGMGPAWPTIIAHAASRLGNRSPRALSWVILGGGIGSLGQTLLGVVAEAYSLEAAMGLAIVLTAGVIACMAVDRLIDAA
jgi:fucose permease